MEKQVLQLGKCIENSLKRALANVRKQGKQRYMPLKWRLLVAMPVALLMVLVGKRWEWIITLFANHKGLLAISFLGSYTIVVLVAGFTHWANRWLDTRATWDTDLGQRLIAQLAMPLAGSWVLSILAAMGLYACFGIDVMQSGYFRFEVWMVLMMLGIMNAGYAFWYVYKKEPIAERKPAIIEVTNERQEKDHVPETHIGSVLAANGFRLIRMINGELYYTSKTISELERILDPDRFCKLRRKLLVNIAVIEKVSKEKIPKIDTKTGAKIIEYKSVLIFGNAKMGRFREQLVKGTVKQFEEWRAANAKKKFVK